MTDPVTIGYGVNKWLKDGNTKIVQLISNTGYANNGNTYQCFTMHNMIDQTNYQVPTGKKLIVIAESAHGIYWHLVTSVDSPLGNAGWDLKSPENNSLTSLRECYWEVPEGKYVNFYTTNNAASQQLSLYCVETTV